MNRQKTMRWDLVLLLAAIGLVRPLLSIAGAYDAAGDSPLAPVLVTVAIAAVWVGVVVTTRAPNSLATLTLAGTLYGVFAIVLQQVVWNLFLGGAPEEAPSSAPVLVMSWISILVTNTIWGAFLGFIASGFRRLR
jgi:hypothetical protein